MFRANVEKREDKLKEAFEFEEIKFDMPIHLTADDFTDQKVWRELLDSLGYGGAVRTVIFWDNQVTVIPDVAAQAEAQAASTPANPEG